MSDDPFHEAVEALRALGLYVEANGARGLLVFCECGHSGAMPFDGLPDDFPVPDVALRLVCSACGRKDRISTRPDFTGVHTGAGPKLRSVE
ncbi:hypothetical protein FV232_24270 [Methylobacterium sp. WL30]|uniref:hypothetical protein n=1 Tax=Methylobacterium sp. WL30 TaxID=2603895 RepID=UPI0011CBE238|nr:hypothetical protein [Methylobacterium sp. WL30]TXN62982.1 hypothetical protein FV232_24270 [Methylobacterium sp. WL30]